MRLLLGRCSQTLILSPSVPGQIASAHTVYTALNPPHCIENYLLNKETIGGRWIIRLWETEYLWYLRYDWWWVIIGDDVNEYKRRSVVKGILMMITYALYSFNTINIDQYKEHSRTEGKLCITYIKIKCVRMDANNWSVVLIKCWWNMVCF